MHLRVVLAIILWTTVSGQSSYGCPTSTYNGNYWSAGYDNLCYLDPKTTVMKYQDAGLFCYNTFGAYLPTVFDALANAKMDQLVNDTETWLGLNSAHWLGKYEWDMPSTMNSTFNKFSGGSNPDTNKFVYMDADGTWKEEGDSVTRKVICSFPQDSMNCAASNSGSSNYRGMYNNVTRMCYRGSGIAITDGISANNFCKSWKTCGNLVKITSAAENYYVSKQVAWETVVDNPWVWIGLRFQNGQLVWSDNTPFNNTYINLGPGTPNDGSCVAMKMTQKTNGDADSAGVWKFMPCSNQLHYVCQSNPYACSI